MTLLILAYGAGLLSTVNPCGFALLPGFLGFYLGDHAAEVGVGVARKLLLGFATGGALSVGFAGTFVVVGLIVAAGLRVVVGALPWAAVVIGAVLTLLGLAMLAGRRLALRLPTAFAGGQSRGVSRVVIFGIAYAIASLSCTVAVFLALIGQALSAGSVPRLLGVFLAYGLGAATVLLTLSVSAALAQAAMARHVRGFLRLWAGSAASCSPARASISLRTGCPWCFGDGPEAPMAAAAHRTVVELRNREPRRGPAPNDAPLPSRHLSKRISGVCMWASGVPFAVTLGRVTLGLC